jgi:hypothetical protein
MQGLASDLDRARAQVALLMSENESLRHGWSARRRTHKELPRRQWRRCCTTSGSGVVPAGLKCRACQVRPATVLRRLPCRPCPSSPPLPHLRRHAAPPPSPATAPVLISVAARHRVAHARHLEAVRAVRISSSRRGCSAWGSGICIRMRKGRRGAAVSEDLGGGSALSSGDSGGKGGWRCACGRRRSRREWVVHSLYLSVASELRPRMGSLYSTATVVFWNPFSDLSYTLEIA